MLYLRKINQNLIKIKNNLKKHAQIIKQVVHSGEIKNGREALSVRPCSHQDSSSGLDGIRRARPKNACT